MTDANLVVAQEFWRLFNQLVVVEEETEKVVLEIGSYVDFYDGKALCGQSLTFDQVMAHGKTVDQAATNQEKLSNHPLETMHEYIQWLFPTNQSSIAGSKHAYAITDAEITKWKTDDARRLKMLQALDMMLNFYGYVLTATEEKSWETKGIPEFVAVEYEKPETQKTRYIKTYNWGVLKKHNHARISRILRSLRLFGLHEESKAFLTALQHEIFEELKNWNLMPVFALHWEPNYRLYKDPAAVQRRMFLDFFEDVGLSGIGITLSKSIEHYSKLPWENSNNELQWNLPMILITPISAAWFFPCKNETTSDDRWLTIPAIDDDQKKHLEHIYQKRIHSCLTILFRVLGFAFEFDTNNEDIKSVIFVDNDKGDRLKWLTDGYHHRTVFNMLSSLHLFKRDQNWTALLVALKGIYLASEYPALARSMYNLWIGAIPKEDRPEFAEHNLKAVGMVVTSRKDFICNSSAKVPIDWNGRSKIANLIAEGKLPENQQPKPPIISSSSFIPKRLAQHLMASKVDQIEMINEQNYPKRKITNMEGLMHCFVTPLACITMSADYRFDSTRPAGKQHLGKWIETAPGVTPQQATHGRKVVLSAAVPPDFRTLYVMMTLITLKTTEEIGVHLKESDFTVLTEKKSTGTTAEAEEALRVYETGMRKHLIYHLTQDRFLPTASDSTRMHSMRCPETITFLESKIAKFVRGVEGMRTMSDILKRLVCEVTIQLGAKPIRRIALEILYHVYLHQLRNELAVLEGLCTDGYVYTIDPVDPSQVIINDPSDNFVISMFNRLQAAAFASIAKDVDLKNLRMIAFNDRIDKGMVTLYTTIVDNIESLKGKVKVVPKAEIFGGSSNPRGGNYSLTDAYALVLHNNGNAFAQDIEFEAFQTSLNAMIGNCSTAYLALDRTRKDLFDFMV